MKYVLRSISGSSAETHINTINAKDQWKKHLACHRRDASDYNNGA